MFGTKDTTTPTGMEMMLRSLGLAPVLEAANALATSGAVQRIIEFSDLIGPLREQLDRIEARQCALLAAAGLPDPDAAPGEPGPDRPEPGAMAIEHRAPEQPRASGATGRLPNPRPGRGIAAAE